MSTYNPVLLFIHTKSHTWICRFVANHTLGNTYAALLHKGKLLTIACIHTILIFLCTHTLSAQLLSTYYLLLRWDSARFPRTYIIYVTESTLSSQFCCLYITHTITHFVSTLFTPCFSCKRKKFKLFDVFAIFC